ncbi:flagellar hook-associated protein FlgK [Aquincola tertiaricarbonis]|uniref:Flagellar hook-associated protein 1 n=1 Tax=Aquincola tertiaricarbonis TaxID=391953 RepID=A0ABY4S4I3_AQUTE|nr:flagellar hook-associated protein FlgK [Aquincola tertiaricarbonis]URI06245.1 flagellar hook-associated protein FlgK [Aquincola tertiaricarbonis]
MNLIQTALSGTRAAQIGLDVTSQNIANVMTDGYTRQGVQLTTVQPARSGATAVGAGVNVPALIRFSDSYKSLQMWTAASDLAQREVSQSYLTQLEQVLGSDESGISGGLDQFFSALNAASVEPGSSPLRQQVITAAGALAQRFNSLQTVLSNQRTAIAQQRSTVVDQVNTLSADVARLNDKIAAATGLGVNASGLIDERDKKIDEVAKLVQVQVVNQPDGTRSVSLRGGQPLVVGSSPATMRAQVNPDGTQTLKLDFANQTFSLAGTPLGGQLGGLDDLQGRILTPLSRSITEMADQLSTNINNKLTTGYGSDGSAGQPLFVFDATSSTSLLKVNPSVLPQNLGFSSDPLQPGGSDNLLAVIALQQQPVTLTSLGNVLLGDVYSQLVGKLATDSQQNQAALSTAQTVRNQAEASWKSTSGVNKDEEAVNLLQYQQMYQANMKVISIANELFDSTLAMI